MEVGISGKIRQMRSEFYAKDDFKAVEARFLTKRNIDELERQISKKVDAMKGTVKELSLKEKETQKVLEKLEHQCKNMVLDDDF